MEVELQRIQEEELEKTKIDRTDRKALLKVRGCCVSSAIRCVLLLLMLLRLLVCLSLSQHPFLFLSHTIVFCIPN